MIKVLIVVCAIIGFIGLFILGALGDIEKFASFHTIASVVIGSVVFCGVIAWILRSPSK